MTFISNSGATLAFTAGSTAVVVAGTNPILEGVIAGDLAVHPSGALPIAAFSASGLTLVLPAPTTATVPFNVMFGPARSLVALATQLTRDVYTQISAWADRGLVIPVIAQQNAPPTTPADGDRYLIGTSPTGAWATRANLIATWSAAVSSWLYTTPAAGWTAAIIGGFVRLNYSGSAWGESSVSDPELVALAALTSAPDKGIYFTGAGSAATYDLTSLARGLLAGASTAAMLTTLGLTANGQSLVTAANYAAMRSLLGLVIGTNVQAADAELSALAGLTSAANKVPRFTGSGTADLLDFSTDGTLAGNSDTAFPSQRAVKTYVDQIIAAQDAMVFQGVIDASTNPNYPSGDRGHTWRISVAGKVGGASGPNVEAGDLIICLTDGTASGTQAAVGASWSITQTNIDGAVIGPASVTSGRFAAFSDTSGKVIQELTPAQATAALDLFTSSLRGLAPPSGGGTSNFLRADGQWAAPPGGGGGRELLTAARTYFVRTDGNDSNTGLVNNAGGAFLTMQRAFDVICTTLDTAGFPLTIQVGAGSYSDGISFNRGWVGGASITVRGDPTTPANVNITKTTGSIFTVTLNLSGNVVIDGFRCTTTTVAGGVVEMNGFGRVLVGNITIAGLTTTGNRNAFTAGVPGAYITLLTGFTITGDMSGFLAAQFGGTILAIPSTITVTGTRNWTWVFAYCANSHIEASGITWNVTGSVTGTRHLVVQNGVIVTGGSATYFPGSVNGTFASGGQYV